MHPQLEILLELQDLKAQMLEMEKRDAEYSSREIEEDVFRISAEEAIVQLDTKIQEMEAGLDPDVAARYRLVSGRRPRGSVVPVVDGICYGCFVAMPTAMTRSNETLRWCEGCGSFVYFVD
ncbi:MAG: hypothetical protein JSU87_10760 [Gemmatimonadota bacterium]|nr:MAG: hypothetical protein JSU87_10760 [Gemmatimonadota bacterium]